MSKELGEGLFYLAHAVREIAAKQNLSTFHATRAINNFRKYTEDEIDRSRMANEAMTKMTTDTLKQVTEILNGG